MPEPMQYEEIEAIVRRGERDERRKRRQFSLAKLLMWTAVAALTLGLLRMLGLAPIVLACIAGWVTVNAGVRLAFGSVAVCVFSVVAVAIAGAALIAVQSVLGGHNLVIAILWSPLGAIIGGHVGFYSYVALEAAFCVVGLPDGLLRSDRYDRQGPP